MSSAAHKSEQHAHGDPTSALTPWSREAQRSDDAFSELDTILEGPRLTVAEATRQLEQGLARSHEAPCGGE